MAYSTPVATPIVLCAVFPPLALLAVLARFYARHLKNATLKWDDWMLIPSLILVLGNLPPLIIMACYGNLGKKVELTPKGSPVVNDEYVVFQKTFLTLNVTIPASLAVVRTTILMLYYRIFARGVPKWKWSIWALLILNGAWGIFSSFVHLFNCYPIKEIWSPQSKTRRCLTPKTFAHVHAYVVVSIIIDVLMLALPWPMVLSLKLSGRQKAAILGIFGLGSIVLGAAIGKAVTMFRVTHLVQSAGPKQIMYDEAPYIYWTVPETCIALICACLPTLRPLFTKLTPNLLRSHITGSASRSAQHGSKTSKGWSATASGDKFIRISGNKSNGGVESESVQNLNGARTSEGLARDDHDVELADLPQARIRPEHDIIANGREGMYR